MKIETGLEKFIETAPFPLSGNSWAFEPPHPPEFPIPSVGGRDIFWNYTMALNGRCSKPRG